MCLAVLAIACSPRSQCLSCDEQMTDRHSAQTRESNWNWVVVANRDEVHDRPSADMQPWDDEPRILAGRDLKAGGSWLGVHADGRFALLTNFREPGRQRADAPSRGFLVEQFLREPVSPEGYLDALEPSAQQYNGFNLLLGQHNQWWHASNRLDGWMQPVNVRHASGIRDGVRHEAGFAVYGLSNALFDTPWPKVRRTRKAVCQRLLLGQTDLDTLAQAMYDFDVAPDAELPRTGLELDRERLLSSPFILSPGYGTRCTTVVMQKRDGSLLAQETTYSPDGSLRSCSRWRSQGEVWVPVSHKG